MDEKRLMDGFGMSGTDPVALAESIEQIDEMTKTFFAMGRDIMFLSLCDLPEYEKEGFATCYILTKEYLDEFKAGKALHISRIPVEKIGEDLLAQCRKTTGLVCLFENQAYTVSEYAISLLLQRGDLGGYYPTKTKGIIRDMAIADSVFHNNEKMTVVYRQVESLRKIFAFMGGRYALVKQSILLDIIGAFEKDSVMGKPVMSRFSMDQAFTDVDVTFPEAAEEYSAMTGKTVIPGAALCTSDIGMSSVTIRGTYLVGSHRIITDEVHIKHTKSTSEEKILKEADEKIFRDFRKLPETLVRLMGIAIAPEADLSTKKGAKENREALEEAYTVLIKKLYPASNSGIGNKVRSKIIEAVKAEINPEVRYTAFDIADNLMGLSERVDGVGRDCLLKMQRAGANAPYLTEEYFSSSKKAEEEVELLSA